jgi:3-hydroxymyristoyl/3-hydroxydecanoyl-(acyl carrier protein) dehydratase
VLPHRFPFRLVDRREGAHVVAALTLGASGPRGAAGAPSHPLSLAVEILAQASLLLLGSGGGGEAADGEPPGVLAGVEEASLAGMLAPGDRLEAHATLERRLGNAARVRAVLRRDGAPVASAVLLLAENPPAR